MNKPYWQLMAAGVCVCVMVAAGVHAQEESSASNRSNASAAEPAPQNSSTPQTESTTDTKTDAKPATGDSAEDVMKNLVNQMKKSPMVEPSSSTPDPKKGAEKTPGYQPVRVGVDPNIIGTAPGTKASKLRREGEFIISRKGRLVRSEDGLHTLFVFDADSQTISEPPMAVVPCQMLQSMEDLLGQRGEQIRFIVSGQILVYRGVNYVLPTMMTLAEDRGNLQ